MKVISTDKAPKAIGPYSQAIKAGDTIYVSGQIGMDPITGDLVDGGFEAQALQSFRNLDAIVKEVGVNLSNIVQLTIYLVDMGRFSVVNDVMQRFFDAPFPARAAVEVSGLPKGAEIELTATIYDGL